MFEFESARHIIDFGLVVLIWLVQIAIYPSFQHVDTELLHTWHRRYVARMTWIAGPLIIAQSLIVGGQVIDSPQLTHWSSALLVLIAWILTFGVSVPLHKRIQCEPKNEALLKRLVLTNWPRTLTWSVIFTIGWL
jgi:hypothetical protein